MKRICLACDLKENHQLISKYIEAHRPGQVWPEITDSIRQSGITDMEIYLVGNRMFMIIEAEDDFELNKKAKMDKENRMVQEWEELMWKYQQSLPWANPDEKWLVTERIFKLDPPIDKK
jgi:L-rhamnose mutarotase